MLLFSATSFAQEKAEAAKFEKPILISSAGQSADVKLIGMLAKKQNIDVTIEKTATESNLDGVKTLIFVPGFSSKGLGAAGISQEEEMERVVKLVAAANEKKIPIVVLHIGGNARRKGQSDAFNKLVSESAKHIIVVAQGNEDNFFTEISETSNIPLEVVNKISEVGAPFAKLFE